MPTTPEINCRIVAYLHGFAAGIVALFTSKHEAVIGCASMHRYGNDITQVA